MMMFFLTFHGLLGRILADFRTSMQATLEFPATAPDAPPAPEPAAAAPPPRPREIGGPSGPEPTRYGDWERKGRCIDF
jgi:hypothetical protein